jgi:serine protease Do
MSTRWRRIGVGVACAAAIVLPTMAPPAQAADNKTTPKVLDARSLSDRARPAVQLIDASFQAQVSAPEPRVDEELLKNDLTSDPKFQVIALSGDEKAAGEYGIAKFLANPGRYLKPGKARTKDVGIEATGSGFAVTPDGYVVTNAHVVKPEDAELKQQLISIGLKDVIDADSKDIRSSFSGFPDADIKRLLDALVAYTVQNAGISDVKTEVFTAEGKAVPGVVKTSKGIKAEVVSVGKTYPDKDVAILKIQANNLITLPVGDEAGHETGDKLYAIGYPANATFQSGTTSGTELEPTLTDGLISAKKSTEAGVPVLQTTAAIAPGSSGGPALDDTGQVIGLTTAGFPGSQGFNFVMPASIVKDFLNRANVKPSTGQATDLWVKGLDEFSTKHYKKSLQTFNELNAIAPGSPYVQDKVSESQKRITAGENVEDKASLLPVFIGVAVVAALLLVLLFVLLGRRGKSKAAMAGGGTLPPYGTPGPTGTVAAPPGTYGTPGPYSEPPAYAPPPSGGTQPYTPPPPSAPPPAPAPPPSGGFPAPPQSAPPQYSAPPPPPQSAPPQYAPPPESAPPPPPPGSFPPPPPQQ